MRKKHKAHIETSRAKYDRRVRYRAELWCLVHGHHWVENTVDYLGTKIRFVDKCRHCGRQRVEMVQEH